MTVIVALNQDHVDASDDDQFDVKHASALDWTKNNAGAENDAFWVYCDAVTGGTLHLNGQDGHDIFWMVPSAVSEITVNGATASTPSGSFAMASTMCKPVITSTASSASARGSPILKTSFI